MAQFSIRSCMENGTSFFDEKTALTYIELSDGYRYELTAGQLRYNQLQFQLYRMRLTLNVDEKEVSRLRSFSSTSFISV